MTPAKRIWVSLLLIVVLLVMAHLQRPSLATHQERLYLVAANLPALQDRAVLQRPEWAGLRLRDLGIVTLTQDRVRGKLVSFGFGHYIKILDPDWTKQAFALERPQEEH